MSECPPQCPYVREQLRKIVTEAPWLLKESTTNGDSMDEKFIAKRLGVKGADKWQKGEVDIYDDYGVDDRHYDRLYKDSESTTPSGRRLDVARPEIGTEKTTKSFKEEKETGEFITREISSTSPTEMIGYQEDKSVRERRMKAESATQWSVTGKGSDKLVETEFIEQAAKYTGDSRSRLSERDRMDRMDREDGTGSMDRAIGTDRMGRLDGGDRIDRADGVGRMDRADGVGRMDRADGADRMDIADGAGRMDRADGVGRMDRADGAGRMDGADGAGRMDGADGAGRMDGADGADRMDGADGADRMDRMDRVKRTDKETSRQDVADEKAEFALFRDECESSCPRRISRKSRMRKLEEKQRIVDLYLLNKGTRYFEDVCTCSLSCVVRSLSHDSFIRSILTSAALFTIGLKLCSELDAWHLPIRFS